MPHLKFELLMEHPTPVESPWKFEPSETGHGDEADLKGIWRRKILNPYEDYLRAAGGLQTTRLDWQIFDEAVTLEFSFDHTLIDQVLTAYVSHGWIVLHELLEKSEGQHTRQTLDFLAGTLWVVSVLVGQELVRMETRLAEAAYQEWQRAQDIMREYLAYFEPSGLEDGTQRFKYKPSVSLTQYRDKGGIYGDVSVYGQTDDLERQIFILCHTYAKFAQKAKPLKQQLDTRNQRDRSKPKRRAEGSGYEQWYEYYASQYRSVLKQMGQVTADLTRVFPPAVFILDTLPPEMAEPITSFVDHAFSTRSRMLFSLMHDNLQKLVSQLDMLKESLKTSPASNKSVKQHLDRPTKKLPPGGMEQLLLDAVWEGDDDANKIGEYMDLVGRLLHEVESKHPRSWQHAVVKRYYLHLQSALYDKQRKETAWAAVWQWVKVALAVLSILAFLAALIGSMGTVGIAAPGVASVLSVIGWAATSLGIVVMVHEVLSLFAEKEEVSARLEKQLYRLAQTDPNALGEVTQLLKRNSDLQKATTTGLLLQLFQFALEGRIRILAYAMELDGFLSDMNDLLTPPLMANE